MRYRTVTKIYNILLRILPKMTPRGMDGRIAWALPGGPWNGGPGRKGMSRRGGGYREGTTASTGFREGPPIARKAVGVMPVTFLNCEERWATLL